MQTFNEIYLDTRRKLRAAGIAAHDLEARLIVTHAAGKSNEELLDISRLYVTDRAILNRVEDMVGRRLGGEPVAYITGEWEFYSLPLVVNRNVLIPRVDTEVLAEEAIKLMKRQGGQARMLDLCAGCGAVGLAVAANVQNCRVVLADNSDRALAVCRANMLRNRLGRNVNAISLNVMETPPSFIGVFDAIVCNPPYIPTGELYNLDPSVRDYEPVAALDGGRDGLDFFREISANWQIIIKQGGHLLFECGIGQAEDVRKIMEDNGLTEIRTRLDTIGLERVITGTRS